MYTLSKLFTYIFLPPGIFIVILLLAGIFARKFSRLFFISALLLYLLSIRPVSNALLSPLENYNHHDDIIPKAVVVLGGGANPKDPIHATPEALKRVLLGIILAEKNNIPVVFTGAESYLIKKDVKRLTSSCKCEIKSYFEKSSKDTYQNAKFT